MGKILKKSFISVSLAIIIVLSLTFSAFGANFEHIAEELRDLGLFRGTAAGFDLEREPTRAEAVVMMIRFLGLEEAAQRSNATHPFTDVPAWADNYIAYAYQRGLTTGATATEFRPNGICSAQMFVTFILRALGYDDSAGDFTFANAIAFAKDVGIIDGFLAEGRFLRDDMVTVSFLALNAAPRGGGYSSLLERLVSDGAVTAGAAAPLLARFALFEEIVRIENSLADKTRFTADVAMAVNMGLLGSVSARGEVSVIVDDDDVVAEIDMRTRVLNEERVIQSFVSGGYLYTQSEGERTKVRLDAELSDINMEGLLGFSAMDGFALNASYFVTDATRTTQGGRTVFTRYFADSFMNTAMDMVMTIVGVVGLDMPELGFLGGADISISNVRLRYYTDAGGNLVRLATSMRMAVPAGILTITAPLSLEIEILAVGDDVTVTLPDNLGDFVLRD